MIRVVGVHGVANRRPSEGRIDARRNLARLWIGHLGRGPLGAQVHALDLTVAYYADWLQTPGRQGSDGGLDTLDPDVENMIRAWLAELNLPVGVTQGPGTWPLRQALAWIAQRRHLSPLLVESFVAAFFREVATYMRHENGSARRAARDEVANTIEAHHGDVVIAHSLGSVVTYEALWANPFLHVDLLITLGSPLALPHAVFPRLIPTTTTEGGARPPGVQRWINLADPGDLIAIPPRGISRHFNGVDIDDHDVIHAFDFHRAANYLASRRLAEALQEHLGGQRPTLHMKSDS